MKAKAPQKVFSVTLDSGANLKLMRKLEREGRISIIVVDLENGKDNKVRKKVGPVGVWGHVKWGDGSAWGSKGNIYSELLKITDKQHIQDARHLEAHYRTGNDIFITEDKDDILSKSHELKKKFNIIVMSSNELHRLISGDYK